MCPDQSVRHALKFAGLCKILFLITDQPFARLFCSMETNGAFNACLSSHSPAWKPSSPRLQQNNIKGNAMSARRPTVQPNTLELGVT